MESKRKDLRLADQILNVIGTKHDTLHTEKDLPRLEQETIFRHMLWACDRNRDSPGLWQGAFCTRSVERDRTSQNRIALNGAGAASGEPSRSEDRPK